jgi:integrase/recombinase XerD
MDKPAIAPTGASHTRDSFTTFVRERRYAHGVSARTEGWYQQSYAAFQNELDATEPRTITKDLFAPPIERMLQRGVSPITINTYARAINAWLRWMHEEGRSDSLVRIPRLKEPETVLQVFSSDDMARLIAYRPTCRTYRRVYVLALVIVDTGMRLDEVLNLRTTDLDFEDLLITIRKGKGGKQRVIPFSTTLRRVLFKYVEAGSRGLVFCTRDGGPLEQNNIRRDFTRLCKRIGIGGNGVKGGFHVLRHGFATEYLRRGGDVIRLGRILGHSTLEVTRRYVHLQTADLSAVHERLTLLSR